MKLAVMLVKIKYLMNSKTKVKKDCPYPDI